jgi:hypothetical protein
VLAAGATSGDCHTSGAHGNLNTISGDCNLYLDHEGQITFLARLETGGGRTGSDAGDWLPAQEGIYGNGYVPRSAFVSPDGRTLLFRSREKLTAYDNHGVPELYRYRVGAPRIACVSCDPTGEAPESGEAGGPRFSSISFLDISPRSDNAALFARNLADQGDRAFFESAEALSPADTNGEDGCPRTGYGGTFIPSCLDVYEWEAPGTGSCAEGGPSWSPQDEGCLYLISTGKSSSPSFFADASESGDDAFFFTRSRLVGQDQDSLRDVYDARVGGGLPSQNPRPAEPCEAAESCHGPASEAPPPAAAATPNFVGPPDPRPGRPRKPHHHKKKHKHKQRQTRKHRRLRGGRRGHRRGHGLK